MAVDPWGEVLAVQASGEAVLLIERDAERQAALRQRMPVTPAPPLPAGAPGRTAMTAIGLLHQGTETSASRLEAGRDPFIVPTSIVASSGVFHE